MSKYYFVTFVCVLCMVASSCKQQDNTMYPVNLIPAPVAIEQETGAFHLNAQTSIWLNTENANTVALANLLADQLRAATEFSLPIDQDKKSNNTIELLIDPQYHENEEAYSLVVNTDKVVLTASSEKGLFIGTQTIRQLLPKEVELRAAKGIDWTIPNVRISDEPRFKWRGMHLDVSRHFFSKEYIKRFLDYMALYKMNTFHWHLTDDQGWRIEIKKYPELTSKGAFREENKHDRECNKLAKDNPDFEITPGFFQEIEGKKLYGGFYTQEDIKEIIAYAAIRNILIVPEIDMPGHFKAAIDNYPEVSCFGKPDWGHTFSSPLCAGSEQAFELVEHILSEVMELFPGPYIHIGADEVEKTNWKKCKKCQARIKKEQLADEHELQSYFVHRVEKFVNSKGKKMVGWDEILEGGMSKSALMMYWRGWVPDAPTQAVKQGNEVVMSPSSHCYFDYKQDARTLEHLYSFEPVPDGLSETESKQILGGQGNIWTEYIPSEARLDYMCMPRMLALSEVLWTPKEQKNWEDFFIRIKTHFGRLDEMNVNYRVPDIGGLYDLQVFIEADTIKLSSQIENQEIRYELDGSIPSKTSKRYTEPIIVSESLIFQARPFSSKGVGGDVLKTEFLKREPIKAINPNSNKAGVECVYFEGKRWTNVADIGKKDVKKGTYVMETFDLPAVAQKRRSSFALKYKGYLEVTKDDVYTFSLLCDDAGVLKIAGEMVIDNDGMHSPRKKTGQIALAKGLHLIELAYVEGGGGGVLELEMLNEQNVFEAIKPSMLSH